MGTHTPEKTTSVAMRSENAADVPENEVRDAVNFSSTPVKRDTSKKEFLRRGSSSKYDPQQARKKSQGSTQKFKYYTDNFVKGKSASKVSAAPKGTSGIPQLNITKQTAQTKKEEIKPASTTQSPKKTASSGRKSIQASEEKENPQINEQCSALKEAGHPDRIRANNSSRLKPPENRPQASSRLKFNAPSKEKLTEKEKPFKKYDQAKPGSKAETTKKVAPTEEKKVVEKPSASAQKASMSRLAQSKQLFKK